MPRNTFDRENQGAEYFGYEGSSLVQGTDEGKSCYISAGLCVAGAANQPLAGKIKQIDANGDASVQRRGYAEFTYVSTAPTAGAWNNLECGAGGTVQVDDTYGRKFFVDSVDTSATTCIVDLG